MQPAGTASDKALSARRLWSLWDMLNLNLRDLLVLARELGRLVYLDAPDEQPLSEPIKENHVTAFKNHGEIFDGLACECASCKRIEFVEK